MLPGLFGEFFWVFFISENDYYYEHEKETYSISSSSYHFGDDRADNLEFGGNIS